MDMLRILLIIILTIFNFTLFAQNKNELDFTVIPVLKYEVDEKTCMVSGFIEVGERIRTGKYSLIYLHSDKRTYQNYLDSSNRFNFGIIDPGTYFVKIGFFSFPVNEPDFSYYIDTINLKPGGIYDLQILKGKLKKDSCCFVGSSFILPLYFDLASSRLNTENEIVLKDLYQYITKYNLKIEIGLHNDERSDSKYLSRDTCLSCLRAEKIKEYFVSLGAKPDRIVAKGYQGHKPYFINAKTEEQHQLNRRTVVTILKND